MIIEMSIPERLHLMGILPKEGNFLTLRVTRELVSKVGFSADEIKEYEIKEDNGFVQWNPSKNTDNGIEFLDSEIDIIKTALIKLDKEQKLDMNTFAIYEKFMFG